MKLDKNHMKWYRRRSIVNLSKYVYMIFHGLALLTAFGCMSSFFIQVGYIGGLGLKASDSVLQRSGKIVINLLLTTIIFYALEILFRGLHDWIIGKFYYKDKSLPADEIPIEYALVDGEGDNIDFIPREVKYGKYKYVREDLVTLSEKGKEELEYPEKPLLKSDYPGLHVNSAGINGDEYKKTPVGRWFKKGN